MLNKKLNKKSPFLILLLALLSLIFLPLIGIAFWISINQTGDNDSVLEVIETNDNLKNETLPGKKQETITVSLDGINFTYSKSESIISYSGNILLTNGCQTLQNHQLESNENGEKRGFVLKVDILDPSKSGQMCTQVVTSQEVSGVLEHEFPKEFNLEQGFRASLFTIEKDIKPPAVI